MNLNGIYLYSQSYANSKIKSNMFKIYVSVFISGEMVKELQLEKQLGTSNPLDAMNLRSVWPGRFCLRQKFH